MRRFFQMENSPEIDDVEGLVQELTGCQDDLIAFKARLLQRRTSLRLCIEQWLAEEVL